MTKNDHEPELRCFGSGCYEREFATEATAAMHENAYHDGAQTVFLVVPTDDGMSWRKAASR
jgi:hypothetical protein